MSNADGNSNIAEEISSHSSNLIPEPDAKYVQALKEIAREERKAKSDLLKKRQRSKVKKRKKVIDSESDGDDVFSGQEESIEAVSDNEPGGGEFQS